MTWIRFGRNEPLAPLILLPSNRGGLLDLHRYRRDGTLLLFFAPPRALATCTELCAALREALLHEPETELLIVTDHEPDLTAYTDAAVAYDHEAALREQYAGLMSVESAGKALLFVLDRDGSPFYAWVGSCEEGPGLADELARKLQSAAFLCPECSVPDPSSVAMWDVIY